MPSQVPATFVGDKLPAGTAHLVFVRSTHAHAPNWRDRQRSGLCDADGSTGADRSGSPTPGGVPLALSGPMRLTKAPFPKSASRHWPATGCAMWARRLLPFVADNLHDALEAAEAILVDYEPLPSAASIEEAVADDAPRIWPESEGNLCFIDRIGDWDRVQRRLQEATHVTRLDLRVNRVTAAPMETRRALAVPEEGRLVLHAPLQGAAYDPQSSGRPRAEMPAQRIAGHRARRRGRVRHEGQPACRRCRSCSRQRAGSIGLSTGNRPAARRCCPIIRARDALCHGRPSPSTA